MSPSADRGIRAETALGTVGVVKRAVGTAESAAANRAWWDADADDYQQEHGGFLGAVDLVWCPEGLRESDAGLLGPVGTLHGARVLEVGCGAASCARWLATQGAAVVGVDLSAGMLVHAARLAELTGVAVPLVQADAVHLPFASASIDSACSAFGAVPFVADAAALMREVARVLRPGGTWVFAVTHPMRWIFPDDPGPNGLTVIQSYSTGRRTWRPTAPAGRSTSSTTARSATGSTTSSAPDWCSRDSSSRSGRTATSWSGGSGHRCGVPCSPAPRSSAAASRVEHGAQRRRPSRGGTSAGQLLVLR